MVSLYNLAWFGWLTYKTIQFIISFHNSFGIGSKYFLVCIISPKTLRGKRSGRLMIELARLEISATSQSSSQPPSFPGGVFRDLFFNSRVFKTLNCFIGFIIIYFGELFFKECHSKICLLANHFRYWNTKFCPNNANFSTWENCSGFKRSGSAFSFSRVSFRIRS